MAVANPLPAKMTTTCATELLIFARAPAAGRCKTRLARGTTPRHAARLYQAMLEHAVARAAASAAMRVTLVCAPDTRDPMFARLARRYGVARWRQARGDLGRRMHAALARALRRSPRAILIGPDQPALDDDWWPHLASALAYPGAAVMAPTHDGGYWAIGARRAEARLFRGPAWSGPRVARATRRGACRAGLDLSELAPRADIDSWRDWLALERALRCRLARHAIMPATRFEPTPD